MRKSAEFVGECHALRFMEGGDVTPTPEVAAAQAAKVYSSKSGQAKFIEGWNKGVAAVSRRKEEAPEVVEAKEVVKRVDDRVQRKIQLGLESLESLQIVLPDTLETTYKLLCSDDASSYTPEQLDELERCLTTFQGYFTTLKTAIDIKVQSKGGSNGIEANAARLD